MKCSRLRPLAIVAIGIAVFTHSGEAQPGALDPTFSPQIQDAAQILTILPQPGGRLLVGGRFNQVDGVAWKNLARLSPDGSIDRSFGLQANPNDKVVAMAGQLDGKILVAGYFQGFGQTPTYVSRDGLARLNPDGSIDTGFNAGAVSGQVQALAIQPDDGSIIIGGSLASVAGIARKRIARLRSDGSLDQSFDAGAGPDADVRAVAFQPDGKILIGGSFTSVAGVTRQGVARLNRDGSVDLGFEPGPGLKSAALAFAVLSDGGVLVGGGVFDLGGQKLYQVVRLDATGRVDPRFRNGLSCPSGVVSSLLVQDDGDIVIGGFFPWGPDLKKLNIARLGPDGSIDSSFDPGTGPDDQVAVVSRMPDGSIVAGGSFCEVDGANRHGLARFHVNGALDSAFAPALVDQAWIGAIEIQPDGKLLVGGQFQWVGGARHSQVARLNPDGSLDASFQLGLRKCEPVLSLKTQADGRVLVAAQGLFGRVMPDGTPDATFQRPSLGLDAVGEAEPLANGGIVVVGNFTSWGGVRRDRIARLDANGALDSSFTPTADFPVARIQEQPDGKLLISGYFRQVNGVERPAIARLNSDGSLDTGFDAHWSDKDQLGAVTVQPDGKILVGGDFRSVSATNYKPVLRLQESGQPDSSLNLWSIKRGTASVLALQADGRILVGGAIERIGTVNTFRDFVRMNPDGSLDSSFDCSPGVDIAKMSAIAVQGDGKAVVGGGSYQYGTPGRVLVRVIGFVPEDLRVLTVTSDGNGAGTVVSRPSGIGCGSTCSGSFVKGSRVTLRAVPGQLSVFVGWSGGCSGTGVCEVTVDAAKSVTATFGHGGARPRRKLGRS